MCEKAKEEEHMALKEDNYFDQIDIVIENNVMKYQNEAIQVSNISQIRVSKEPPKTYPASLIGAFIGCFICMIVLPVAMPLFLIIAIVFGVKLAFIAKYNSNLKTYLIIETNSGRISLFSARDESFLVKAKNSLIECFNDKKSRMVLDFSNCVINGSSFGDNSQVNNK